MTALFLAVDGGNSKTDVVLGTTDGRVLGFVRGPTSSPHLVGIPGSMRVLDTLIRAVRGHAGLPPSAEVDLVGVYLAGADLPIEVERLTAAVAERGWARNQVVENDTFAVLRAGTSMPDAIVVVCGAGINCAGRTADGRTARFPALGEISGDWGGGHHLAERALWYAARGEDGRGTPTALSAAVARHLGRSTVEDVGIGLHLGDIPRSAVHTLSPVLFTVAATGDAVAERLVQRQVHEIRALHRVAAERLGLRNEPHALVLGGGVLKARQPLLHDPVVAGVLALSPEAVVTVLADAPVVGAALLALDMLTYGGSPVTAQVEQALRTTMRRDPDEVLGATTAALSPDPAFSPADPALSPDPILDAPPSYLPSRGADAEFDIGLDYTDAPDYGYRSTFTDPTSRQDPPPGHTSRDLGPVGPLW